MKRNLSRCLFSHACSPLPQIFVSESGGAFTEVSTITFAHTSTIVPELTPGTPYAFSVAVINTTLVECGVNVTSCNSTARRLVVAEEVAPQGGRHLATAQVAGTGAQVATSSITTIVQLNRQVFPGYSGVGESGRYSPGVTVDFAFVPGAFGTWRGLEMVFEAFELECDFDKLQIIETDGATETVVWEGGCLRPEFTFTLDTQYPVILRINSDTNVELPGFRVRYRTLTNDPAVEVDEIVNHVACPTVVGATCGGSEQGTCDIDSGACTCLEGYVGEDCGSPAWCPSLNPLCLFLPTLIIVAPHGHDDVGSGEALAIEIGGQGPKSPKAVQSIQRAAHKVSIWGVIMVYPGVYNVCNALIEVANVRIVGLAEDPSKTIFECYGQQGLKTVADNTVIQGITFRGGSGVDGGNIHVDTATIFTMDNCVIENGMATNGGGMYVQSGVVFLEHIIMRNNAAATGGGIYVAGGSVQVQNSTVVAFNSASGSGGGIYMESAPVLATFVAAGLFQVEDNVAGTWGGNIAMVGIKFPALRYIDIARGYAGAGGGGVYAQRCTTGTMEQLSIRDNLAAPSAGGEGGGLYMDRSDFTITNVAVEDNRAAVGGGAVLRGTDLVNAGEGFIRDNSAAVRGGDVHIVEYGSMHAFNISGSTSEGDAGGLSIADASLVTLTEVDIFNNSALGGRGGGLLATNVTSVIMEKCSVRDSQAQRGGGMYVAATSLDGRFQTIVDSCEAEVGGGVTLASDATVQQVVVGSTRAVIGGGLVCDYGQCTALAMDITDGNATDRGGTVAVLENATLTTEDVNVIRGHAVDGGLLYMARGAQVACVQTVWQQGVAAARGGAVFCDGCTALSGAQISQSSATTGGCMYANLHDLGDAGATAGVGGANLQDVQISSVVMQACSASRDAGGMFVETQWMGNGASPDHTMARRRLAGGATPLPRLVPTHGRSRRLAAWPTVRMNAVTVSQCHAAGAGGGLKAASTSIVHGGDVVVQHNSALVGGGVHLTNSAIHGSSEGVTILMNSNTADGTRLAALLSTAPAPSSGDAAEYTRLAGAGGSMYGTTCALSRALVQNSGATSGAGMYAENGPVTLDSVLVRDNDALVAGGGLTLLQTVPATFTDLVVSGNTALASGGGMYMEDAEVVATFTNITRNAAKDGAGLHMKETSLRGVASFYIVDNPGAGATLPARGGGIFVQPSTCNITGISVLQCTARDGGGAVFMDHHTYCGVRDSVIAGNEVTSGTGTGGAGLFVGPDSALVVDDTLVRDNVCAGAGGGFSTQATRVVMTNCALKGNIAGVVGGGVAAKGGEWHLSETEVRANAVVVPLAHANTTTSAGGGGVAVMESAILTIVNSLFTTNEARFGTGGAVSAEDSWVSIRHSRFEGNRSTSMDAVNGSATTTAAAMEVVTVSPDTGDLLGLSRLAEAYSHHLTHARRGGAIHVARSRGAYRYLPPPYVTLDPIVLVVNATSGATVVLPPPNEASGWGSEIYNVTLVDHYAFTGGAIDLVESEVSLSNLHLQGNMAAADGGGVAAEGSELTVANLVLHNNTAGFLGGGVALKDSRLGITDTVFHWNTAQTGGGLSAADGSTVTAERLSFVNNWGEVAGGGASVGRASRMTLIPGTFTGNVGGCGGALHAADADNVWLGNCSITDNSAVHDGGGLCLEHDSVVQLARGMLLTNVAARHGGFAEVRGYSTLNLAGVTATRNVAGQDGGVVHLWGTLPEWRPVFVPRDRGVQMVTTMRSRHNPGAGPGGGAIDDELGIAYDEVTLRDYGQVVESLNSWINCTGCNDTYRPTWPPRDDAAVVVTGSRVSYNVAGRSGAVIGTAADGDTWIHAWDSHFMWNAARLAGGVVYTSSGGAQSVTLTWCKLLNNSATEPGLSTGGALDLRSETSKAVVKFSEIRYNDAFEGGGVYYRYYDRRMSCFGCEVAENQVYDWATTPVDTVVHQWPPRWEPVLSGISMRFTAKTMPTMMVVDAYRQQQRLEHQQKCTVSALPLPNDMYANLTHTTKIAANGSMDTVLDGLGGMITFETMEMRGFLDAVYVYRFVEAASSPQLTVFCFVLPGTRLPSTALATPRSSQR